MRKCCPSMSSPKKLSPAVTPTSLQDDHSPHQKINTQKLDQFGNLNGPTEISLIFKERKNSAFSVYDPIRQQIPCSSIVRLNSSSSLENDESSNSDRQRKNQKESKQSKKLETKNLNRYFRSKLNEMLRDIRQNSKNLNDQNKANQILEQLNKENKIMFSEIRTVLKDAWLNEKLQECSGRLLRFIHSGKMGMQSKLTMLKYFNKIKKAVIFPDEFSCWK